jgi:hypothetical protein
MIIQQRHFEAFMQTTGLRQKDIAERLQTILNKPFHPSNITNYVLGREIPDHVQHALLTALSDIQDDGMIYSSYPDHKVERFVLGFDKRHEWVAVHNGYPFFMARMTIGKKGKSDMDVARINAVLPLSPNHTEQVLFDDYMPVIQKTANAALKAYKRRVESGIDSDEVYEEMIKKFTRRK